MCERTVSPPFVCFDKLFPPISELIVLARWVKFNSLLMPGLVLIVLSGTESNRGIKLLQRLAIFNPGLAIIGFPGTGARSLSQILPLLNLAGNGKYAKN